MKRRRFIRLATGFSLGIISAGKLPSGRAQAAAGTGFAYHKIFLEHHLSIDHPESPDRLKVLMQAMNGSGLLPQLNLVERNVDAFPWIYSVHSRDHIGMIRAGYGHSHDVAIAVVSSVLSAVDQVCNGHIKNAFCATRPPGHHALNTGKEEGFCFYNAVAIAARYAQEKYQFKKILIVDWDYHHGNSTEAVFYSDPDVLFFSTHDFYAYPGTGDPARTGTGAGEGMNINVHLPCGTTDQDIINVYEKVLVPAAEKFKPQLILVSAGFDSRENDLLGCFDVTDDGFVELTRIVMSLANKFCDGRVVSVLEGGYNLEGNASAALNHVRTLMSS